MALFEGYERRVAKINAVLAEYGISSIEECKEITLAAGRNGQLQYLKKGSAVLPSEIAANLVEWGKLNPKMMNIGGVGTNLNMIRSAVVQPNYEFNFDSLVHVDHCDEGTLKSLEKMVDTKINDFSKQLNYSIKKFAR